jgi:hypothetical protein
MIHHLLDGHRSEAYHSLSDDRATADRRNAAG